MRGNLIMTHQAPSIYVSCLAAYNSGKLHGEWIECTGDADQLWDSINKVIATSPEPDAEEWAVHDYENWHGLSISECPDVEEISTWAELINEHGAAIAKFIAWANNMGITADADEFQARYCGYYESPKKFVLESNEVSEQYEWEEFSSRFPTWSNCIDWEHFANELELSDAYQYIHASASEGHGIYVFKYM
jgi:antirestriction protein